MYLVFPKSLFTIADLFALRFLWVVGNEDKFCVVTAADIRFAWVGLLGLFTFASIACLLQQANAITLFERRPNKKLVFLHGKVVTSLSHGRRYDSSDIPRVSN